MPRRDIIVVGASAGGIDALVRMVRGLPPALPATLFVVCHLPSGFRSALPSILSRNGPLLATPGRDGDPFNPGHIYVAPPDQHLLLAPGGRMRLTRGPRENNHRPAVDPLFRSAARHYDSRVVAVELSGSMSDGAGGLMAVRSAGGLAVVQDPADALVAAMPQSALQIAGADHVVAAADLGPLLAELVRGPAASRTGGSPVPDPLDKMPDTVNRDMEQQARDLRLGEVSTFTCPECGGNLWQVDEKDLVRFRCHVGHAYNGDVLFAEQAAALEAALWTAVRMFRERSVLARQLAQRERGEGGDAGAARFDEQAAQAERYSDLIKRYVLEPAPPPGAEPVAPPGGATKP
jgi:two-component system chemotaxis response regulator CheB